jgi:hypothetical protein
VEIPHQRPAQIYGFDSREDLEKAVSVEGMMMGWRVEVVTSAELDSWEDHELHPELRDRVADRGQALVVIRGENQAPELVDGLPDRFELGLEGLAHDLHACRIWSVDDLREVALSETATGHQGLRIQGQALREWEAQTGMRWLTGYHLQAFRTWARDRYRRTGVWPDTYTADNAVVYGPEACRAAIETMERL